MTGQALCSARQRTEHVVVELRAMLERANGFEPNVVEGRFMIQTRKRGQPWIVSVEPDIDAKLLLIVIVYEVP
jgi:hypothetical protein